MNSTIRYTFFIFSILLFGSSCSSLRYLEEDQTMLRKNKIEITNKKDVDNVRSLQYSLESIPYQKPNSKFIGLTTAGSWYYYRNKDKAEKNWWTRFVMKNLAEEPAVYSIDKADASARSMERYLHQKGYFDATVEFETKRKGIFKKRKMHVNYIVNSGKRYYYDTIRYISKDTAIQNILEATKEESFLKSGSPVDVGLYNQETQRITNHLKNNGYANFYVNYIAPLDGDSIGTLVNADLQVLLTKDSVAHRKYRIGNVSVISMFDDRGDPVMDKDTTYNGIKYYVQEGKHFIKLRTLDREIFLKQDDLYKIDNINKTKIQLRDLDIFQFVDVRRLASSPEDSLLNYMIRLIPTKRQEFGIDFELNSSNSQAAANANRASLGTSVSLNYKNRNFFRGGEVLTLQTEGGVEFFPKDFRVNAWNLNLVGSMNIPRYYDFLKTDKLWTRLLLGKNNKFYGQLQEQGISNASLRYNIISNTGSFRIDIFAGTLGWNVRPNNRLKVSVNKVGIDFLDPFFTPEFKSEFVDNNPFLERSLRPQLFTGLLFRDINFLYRRNTRFGGNASWLARGNLEVSGAEARLANWVYNQVTNDDIAFKLFNKYEFSQYIKLEGDLRYFNQFKGGRMFASRLNTGVAVNYGNSVEVPYVKQFFIGGPNSMRAWRVRELGPGSYQDPNVNTSSNFYQTGDFKLEFNAEYRFDLFWYFKGAIFLDVGNIWAFNNNSNTRPGAGFNGFLDEIAVGSGFGIRLDVDYFVIRSDFGYPLRNPFENELGKNWLVNKWSDLSLNKFEWQLAVGYPF